MTKYDDFDWDELPAEAQEAAKVLGFTKEMWNADQEPKECNKSWKRLPDEQKAAAGVLGYDQATWDAS
ncbi:hypothetical protein ACHAXN_010641 [Cyclotella atomus]